MITACPVCRTVFRITQAQLAAREGTVRCGKCGAVFDARNTLQSSGREPEGGDRIRTQSAFAESEPVPPAPPDVPHADDATPSPTPAAPAPLDELPTPQQTATEMDAATPAAEPARVKRRAGWAAASALLVIGLMAQAAFYYRGEIAILFPEIRPKLIELCANLACDIPLPRRAELISIESSDLQADPANPSVMMLTATLRNRAAFLQSYPSLELTLTNTQDQVLARRVFGVRDYLDPGARAGAGFAANSELHVKVYMDASSLKATGYRLYLFFP